MTSVERPVPYDIALEESVLGALLIDRDAIIKVEALLRPGHFYRERNGAIYAAICALYKRREPPEPRLIFEELRVQGKDVLLSELIGMVDKVLNAGHSVHAEYYAARVVKYATLRRLISAGGEIAALGFNEADDLRETLARASMLLTDIKASTDRAGVYDMRTMLDEFWERMDLIDQSPDKLVGVPSGFADLDAITGGFQRSHFVVLGGRTGHGKTACMCNMALEGSRAHSVGFLSLEMSREELMERWVSEVARVDSRKLRQGKYLTPQERQRISDAMGALDKRRLYVDDKPGQTLSEVRSSAYILKAEYGIDMLYVDYLQKIKNSRRDANRTQEVGEIARELKDLARELNIPIMAGAQINRAVEGRSDHTPTLADLRESGDIEHEANIVVFIYRPEMYGQTADNMGVAKLIVAKNRSGTVDEVTLRYEPALTKFQAVTRVYSEVA
jgi:replicative DNA helicase